MYVDSPPAGASVAQAFAIAGWAIDRCAMSGTGVDTVHVWAYPPNNGVLGTPVAIGAAYGGPRPDVAAFFGDSRFTNSGYHLNVAGLAAGTYRFVIYAHSTVTGTFDNIREVDVTIGGP